MTRWKAAGSHLALSAMVAILALTGMLIFWFPWTYFQASGADRLLFILILVDVVAGPFLTFIIFKSGKWGLKFDLWAIGIFQLLALLYGLHVMWQSRPVFLVFAVDRFNLVFANQVPQSELDRVTIPEFKSLSWSGPRLAFAQVPDDETERSDLLIRSVDSGRDIETMPVYFKPISIAMEQIIASGFKLDESLPEKAWNLFDRLAESSNRPLASMVGLPLFARGYPKTLVIDRLSGTPIGVVDYIPWQAGHRSPSADPQ